MSSRSIIVAEWTIPGSEAIAVVTVSYPTLADMRRAYTVDVQPTTFERYPDGVTIRRYTPSEGYRALIADAPRYNAKQLERYATDAAVLETARGMFARICAARGIDAPERFASLA
jgi:hypothetical protein